MGPSFEVIWKMHYGGKRVKDCISSFKIHIDWEKAVFLLHENNGIHFFCLTSSAIDY